MKRIIYIVLVISFLVLGISIFIKPAIRLLVKAQLQSAFVGSKVAVGACSLRPFHLLTISDIEVKRGILYDFKVKEIGIQYSIISILKQTIPQFYLRGASISLNLPENISEFTKYLNPDLLRKGEVNFKPRRRPILVKSLELSNLELNLKAKDLNTQARLSAGLNLVEQLVDYLDVQVNSLESRRFQLKDASLKVSRRLPAGELNIAQIKYDKARIEELRSKVRLEDKSLFMDSLTAKALEGRIAGNLSLQMDQNADYSANLRITNLDFAALVRDFKLGEKFRMTGKLDGKAVLKGRGVNLSILSGDFSTAEPGGILVIRDNKFLENVARSSGQSLDILVESFKDYHYNTGILKLSLDKGNLILDLALDGKSGKRNLNIVIHNFKL